ncbi:MAG TPA: hypothetical protein VK534_01670, partial [Methylomirabilota bacterium]|nr:hypothetical protein [Methylomirabilota bacterium]
MDEDQTPPIEPIEPAEVPEQQPDNEVRYEESMADRRQGQEHAADVLDTDHSRIVERRTVENVMEDSYLRYSM